jgi:hypothetical protein
MPLPSVTVNVTETDPAGSEATDASRMSLCRPAPAACVGAGVGDELVDALDRTDPRERGASDLRAVGDDDRAARALHQREVRVRLDLVMGHESVLERHPVGAEEHRVQVEPGERLLCERADELVGLRARPAPGDDELQVRPDRELARDVERVRHDGEPLALDEHARDLGGRGAAREAHGLAVGHAGGGLERDPALLLLVVRGLVAQRQLVQDALRDGAAVRAREQALVVQQLEVAPDRRRRDGELGREVGHAHAAARGELLEDRADALCLTHARSLASLDCVSARLWRIVRPNERNRA